MLNTLPPPMRFVHDHTLAAFRSAPRCKSVLLSCNLVSRIFFSSCNCLTLLREKMKNKFFYTLYLSIYYFIIHPFIYSNSINNILWESCGDPCLNGFPVVQSTTPRWRLQCAEVFLLLVAIVVLG